MFLLGVNLRMKLVSDPFEAAAVGSSGSDVGAGAGSWRYSGAALSRLRLPSLGPGRSRFVAGRARHPYTKGPKKVVYDCTSIGPAVG